MPLVRIFLELEFSTSNSANRVSQCATLLVHGPVTDHDQASSLQIIMEIIIMGLFFLNCFGHSFATNWTLIVIRLFKK